VDLNKAQFPESLKGFQRRGIALPETVNDFSSSALAGHNRTRVSANVKTISPKESQIFQALTQEKYKQASTDLTNMRKSGEAAAHGALMLNNRNSNPFSDPLSKKNKQTIKIRSN
jgi:hypothetical protein